MKKKYILLIIIIIIVAIPSSAFVLAKTGVWGMGAWYLEAIRPEYVDVKAFRENKEDFQVIADLVLKHKDELEKIGADFVSFDSVDGDYVLFNYENDDHIRLNKQEQESLMRIWETFYGDNCDFDKIWVNNNRIAFSTRVFDFAVVYSLDNSRPTYIYSPDEDNYRSYYTKKLMRNWYYIGSNDYK